MPQIAYYFWAAVNLGAPERPVSFAVPTGNFGNVYAAYAARQMGLPIDRLVIGSNANDILTRFFASGEMEMRGVVPTLSPSMDIQVSSNFERLLFDLFDRRGAEVEATLTGFRRDGRFAVGANQLGRAAALFLAGRSDDDEAVAIIRRLREETGELLDTHPAPGIAAVEGAQERRVVKERVSVCQSQWSPSHYKHTGISVTQYDTALNT